MKREFTSTHFFPTKRRDAEGSISTSQGIYTEYMHL